MTLDQIYGQAFDARIGRSVVGFIHGQPATSVQSIGSGTLVKYQDIGGVLTCSHVLESLLAADITGVVTFPVRKAELQNTTFNTDNCDIIGTGTRPWTEHGPDLGILILDPSTFSALCSLGSPVDLERQSTLWQTDPPETPCIEALAGVVHDWSVEETASPTGRGLMKALLSQGQVTSRSPVDPNTPDILTFRPDDPPDLIPKTYEGVSGGGLWRIHIQDDGGPEKLTLLDVRLAGVAFWETSPPKRNIICHGPRDIYDGLLPQIREYKLNRRQAPFRR